MDQQKTPDNRWPSVFTAYDYVLPSHQMMASRVEAMGKRTQDMMTFAATITLGFPVLGQAVNKSISFGSAPFITAVILFVVLMCFGIVAREWGNFSVVSPAKVYETSLHLSEWEFKRDAIYKAGECFNKNWALIDRKADLIRVMSGILLLEVICFLAWIARS